MIVLELTVMYLFRSPTELIRPPSPSTAAPSHTTMTVPREGVGGRGRYIDW